MPLYEFIIGLLLYFQTTHPKTACKKQKTTGTVALHVVSSLSGWFL